MRSLMPSTAHLNWIHKQRIWRSSSSPCNSWRCKRWYGMSPYTLQCTFCHSCAVFQERLRQRTLLLEEQEAALEQREVELLQKAARQEEESVALAAAAAGAEDRVKQAHEEHGRTVASAQSLAAQILTEARQGKLLPPVLLAFVCRIHWFRCAAAARIQEDAKESAQKVLESARQREAAILLKLKKLEEETEARCNAAWTEVTDRAQALVSGAEAKSADTVAAADVLAASIRKKAEDEAETMVSVSLSTMVDIAFIWNSLCVLCGSQLRKARASAKDITSVATAQAQADLDKAVAKARDEAACEAEKQAAKRIADVRHCSMECSESCVPFDSR